jgi:hypothetical protein
MKKIILTLTAITLLVSCSNNNSILNRNKYTIIDTTSICRNGFGKVLVYDVIILNHYDSMYHAGEITPDGRLVEYNAKPIKLK